MDFWFSGQEVMSLVPSEGSGVGRCVNFGVLVGLVGDRLLRAATTKVARSF